MRNPRHDFSLSNSLISNQKCIQSQAVLGSSTWCCITQKIVAFSVYTLNAIISFNMDLRQSGRGGLVDVHSRWCHLEGEFSPQWNAAFRIMTRRIKQRLEWWERSCPEVDEAIHWLLKCFDWTEENFSFPEVWDDDSQWTDKQINGLELINPVDVVSVFWVYRVAFCDSNEHLEILFIHQLDSEIYTNIRVEYLKRFIPEQRWYFLLTMNDLHYTESGNWVDFFISCFTETTLNLIIRRWLSFNRQNNTFRSFFLRFIYYAEFGFVWILHSEQCGLLSLEPSTNVTKWSCRDWIYYSVKWMSTLNSFFWERDEGLIMNAEIR